MYKIVYDNVIIDVLKTLKCIRYITKNDKIISCGYGTAHGIYSSNNKNIYILEGRNVPQGLIDKGFHIIKLYEIPEAEYIKLYDELRLNKVIYNNANHIYLVRQRKIEELSTNCNETITSGISVRLSDGYYHKYRLTIEDQLNLLIAEKELMNGAKRIMYHETNGLCEPYSARDMRTIIDAANKHRNYHTTYFNVLKYCINNMNTVEDIIDIYYGIDILDLNISNDLKVTLKEKLYG